MKNRSNSIGGRVSCAMSLLVTVLLVGAVAAADYFCFESLFRNLDCGPLHSHIYAAMLSALHNIAPCYAAKFYAQWSTGTAGRHRTRKANEVGMTLSILTFVLTAGAAVMMRILWIGSNGGFEAFMGGQYGWVCNSAFIVELFEMCAPILCALLVFLAVWLYARKKEAAQDTSSTSPVYEPMKVKTEWFSQESDTTAETVAEDAGGQDE